MKLKVKTLVEKNLGALLFIWMFGGWLAFAALLALHLKVAWISVICAWALSWWYYYTRSY